MLSEGFQKGDSRGNGVWARHHCQQERLCLRFQLLHSKDLLTRLHNQRLIFPSHKHSNLQLNLNLMDHLDHLQGATSCDVDLIMTY